MTDGMVTRARAVDDQLSSMADQLARHDSTFAKIDCLCSTVQLHAESFDLLRKSHAESFDVLRTSLAAQQAVMSDMMVKLQHLDKVASPSVTKFSSSQPPLLPLPTSHPPSPMHHSSELSPPSLHSNSSSPPNRPPKIKVPLFAGEDDVLGWLFQINHYFVFNQIPADQRLSIAAFYMTGPARQWFQWLYSTDQLTHWDDFVRKLE